MQRIDFFRLDRPIQERFIAATHGAASPVPLAVRKEPLAPGVLRWAGIGLGALLLLVLLTRLGFGDLQSSLALHPPWLIGAYTGLGLLAAFAARRAFRVHAARRALPFAPAVYVFPSGVIDTRGREFVVRPLRDLRRVDAKDSGVALAFDDGARFRFRVGNRDQAQALERTLSEYKRQLGAGSAQVNARELAMLDPLCDNGFRNPFSPVESIRPARLRRFQPLALVLLAAGAALGTGVFFLRNYLGEHALYSAARKADTRAAYLAYAERGGQRGEVRDILLPRTELARVLEGGLLVELERFAEAHRSSTIAPEIDGALQQALRRELEVARSKGTLSALKAFAEAHGKHPAIAAEAQRAIDDHWKARLRAFERRTQPKPEVMEFFRRLLAYTSQNDNLVEVRFRRRVPESVERAEKMLRKSLQFGGEASLPGQYFDPAHAARREEPVGRELVAGLRDAFPDDLVRFELKPPMSDSPDDVPAVEVPTLLVTHRTEMSGAYLMRRPRAALSGIGVLFRVTFQIPKDTNPHAYKYSVWSAPDLRKAEAEQKTFEQIYDEMATRAFQKLPKRYLHELFPGLDG